MLLPFSMPNGRWYLITINERSITSSHLSNLLLLLLFGVAEATGLNLHYHIWHSFWPGTPLTHITFLGLLQSSYYSRLTNVHKFIKQTNVHHHRHLIFLPTLFTQAVSLVGDAEKFLMHQKDALQTALARLLVKKKVKTPQDLVDLYRIPGLCVSLIYFILCFKLSMCFTAFIFSHAPASHQLVMPLNHLSASFILATQMPYYWFHYL